MATSYTTNARLQKPALNDTGWDAPINANADALDGFSAIGALCVAPAESPSSSLNVRVSGGSYRKADGTVGTYGGVAQTPVSANATRYLYLTDAGALTTGTAWPTTAHVRLATVLAGPSTITSVADARVVASTCGTPLPDGANFAFGTSTGTKIGTDATQLLAFYGGTPTARPSLPSATASNSYGTNEQTMLQAIYNLARTLGLGG